VADHVVEGEEAAKEDDVLRLPAMPEVLDAEGLVEAAAVHVGVAQPGVELGHGTLGGDAGVDEAPHEGVGGIGRASVMLRELRPREDAGVEADQGEPGRFVVTEAEFAEGVVSAGAQSVRQRCESGSGRANHP
jgi:hypothetical protein